MSANRLSSWKIAKVVWANISRRIFASTVSHAAGAARTTAGKNSDATWERLPTVYLGVGIGVYDHPSYSALPRAVPDVTKIGEVLEGRGYSKHVVEDVGTADAVGMIKAALPSDLMRQGGALILLWSGHGAPTPERKLQLVVKDMKPGEPALITPDYLAGVAVRTGASQVLLIFDTCHSGIGAIPVLDVANNVWSEQPPGARPAWIGVVASASNFERARDGEFGKRLARLLEKGPTNPEENLRWSIHNAGVRGDDVIHALLSEWDVAGQRPQLAQLGFSRVMLPNPRFDPDAPERVVEHLLLAARGVAPGEEGSYFTGRVGPLEQIVTWMHADRPGVFVVTGPAGSGKSAIVGRVVSLSNPTERAARLDEGPLEHTDPGPGSVHAHVYVRRGLTVQRFVEALEEQLVRGGVIPANPSGPRNRGELQGAIERSGVRPMIAVDGLDEAGSESWRIADDAIRLLATTSRVLVSTRELPSPTGGRTLVNAVGPSSIVDLGAEVWEQDTGGDVCRYVARRLADHATSSMDADQVGATILRLARAQGEGLFLLARVITTQLSAEPVDTSLPGWEGQLAQSVEAAFERDLTRVPPRRRDDQTMPHAARELLTALAWSYGAGLPADVWPVVATALSPTASTYVRDDDVFWLLREAGRYIVEDGEGGQAVYRLSHQRLVEHLRPHASFVAEAESSGASERLAAALVDYYLELLSAGHSPKASLYLWLHGWRHCADAGQTGIAKLRELIEREDDVFRLDLALALVELGTRYDEKGRWQEAVGPTEEAVTIYREIVATNAAFRGQLATALYNLGNQYSTVGRWQEAVAATEEAVTIRRELAATNAAFRRDLAGALNSLANRYRAVGRWQEAVGPAEEAVTISRELAATNAASSDLAIALDTLGNRYSDVGRLQEAVASTEEAVAIDRELAVMNAAYRRSLAASLTNLGNRYSEVGRRGEAVGPTEEAVTIRRELATANEAFRPALAETLNNLGMLYSEVGRVHEAVGPTEEAASIRRELAATNDAFRPVLGETLVNLGMRYSEVGRMHEALIPAEEAGSIFRELAATNVAFRPHLAKALNNLGVFYSAVGRREEAMSLTEEAVAISRDLAATNPVFRSDLGLALSNLGNWYSQAGRRQEAAAPNEEAVTIYRELAATNAAFRPRLAMAVGNLGIRYGEAGRRLEAVALTEEAASIYGELAATNAAFRPDLAKVLNNLGQYYSKVGRRQEAVAAAEEAVTVRRELAGANAAFRSALATALSNLGKLYSEVGRPHAGVAATEEAVTIQRGLAATNAAFPPDLAAALNSLGVRYAEAGRMREAVGPTEEAVSIYREQASADPALRSPLAVALKSLGERYRETGKASEIDEVWRATIASLADPAAQAFLLLRRAEARTAADPAAIDDLLAARALIEDDRGDLIYDHHRVCRTRRAQDLSSFDRAWCRRLGPDLPDWLLIDQADVELMLELFNASRSMEAGRRFLADNAARLLTDKTDDILDELALALDESLEPFRDLLKSAREIGIEQAYGPVLAAELLRDWINADLETKRSMLSTHRDHLLGPDLAEVLAAQRENDPENEQLSVHEALLVLARSGHGDVALRMLTAPETIPTVLAEFARAGDTMMLDRLCTLVLDLEVLHVEATAATFAAAGFHLAVACALEGERDAALAALELARARDSSQMAAWLGLLVELAARHPEVISLSQALTASPRDSDR